MSARKVNHAKLRELFATKKPYRMIAQELGVGLNTIKDNVRFLGLRRGKGYKWPGYGEYCRTVWAQRRRYK